jgi:hypothetical protein
MIRKAPSPVPFEGGLECRPEDRAAPALVIEPTGRRFAPPCPSPPRVDYQWRRPLQWRWPDIDRFEAALGDAKCPRSAVVIVSPDRERTTGADLHQQAGADQLIDNLSGAFAFKVCLPWFEADRRMGMIPAIAGFKQSEHLICCAIHRLTTAGVAAEPG